jgi:chemotaxis protein MotB
MRRDFRTELLDAAAAGDAHADRWVLSYADFITLLFAFFVVMYSISSVSDGKFRVLSASLVDVFNDPRVSAALDERGRASAMASQRREVPEAESDGRALEAALLRADELGAVLSTYLADAIASGAVKSSRCSTRATCSSW